MKTAEEHYLADPIPSDASLTEEEKARILGGEVCMWSEQLNERTIDSRIWPRTAAIAERFWSPADCARCGGYVPATLADLVGDWSRWV